MIYVAGKGDGNIRYYEIVDEEPWIHYLTQYLSGSPQRGLGFMPKRGVQTQLCETFRFYKLHATRGLCEPISMIVPRKSETYQDDLYPDTAAPTPALTAEEWIKGTNRDPVLMSMKTGSVLRKLTGLCQKVASIQLQFIPPRLCCCCCYCSAYSQDVQARPLRPGGAQTPDFGQE